MKYIGIERTIYILRLRKITLGFETNTNVISPLSNTSFNYTLLLLV